MTPSLLQAAKRVAPARAVANNNLLFIVFVFYVVILFPFGFDAVGHSVEHAGSAGIYEPPALAKCGVGAGESGIDGGVASYRHVPQAFVEACHVDAPVGAAAGSGIIGIAVGEGERIFLQEELQVVTFGSL